MSLLPADLPDMILSCDADWSTRNPVHKLHDTLSTAMSHLAMALEPEHDLWHGSTTEQNNNLLCGGGGSNRAPNPAPDIGTVIYWLADAVTNKTTKEKVRPETEWVTSKFHTCNKIIKGPFSSLNGQKLFWPTESHLTYRLWDFIAPENTRMHI